MRLMNPGLGELLDRLSILELKLAHGGGEQFEEERQWVHTRILEVNGPSGPEVFWLNATLAAVNAAIWQSEDALRDLRLQMTEPVNPSAVPKSAFLAHKIQALNDKRAELVREIGRLAGEQDHREKLSGGQS